MNRNYLISALLAGVFNLVIATSAYAQSNQCTCVTGATRMSANDITALLPGKTVCAVNGNDKWQEYHDGNNVVELGNSTAGDLVGTWSATGGNAAPQSTITYNYGSGGSYTYVMCSQGNPATAYHFCGATIITNASITAGKQKCWQ